MKSRINKKAHIKIIAVNIPDSKTEGLYRTSEQMKAELILFGNECAEMTVGQAVGFNEYEKKDTDNQTEKAVDECLIFSGFDSRDMDKVLKLLRENNAVIPLKCVVTQHNRNWKIAELVSELKKEHEYMNK